MRTANLVGVSDVFTRKGYMDTPVFAAQNCTLPYCLVKYTVKQTLKGVCGLNQTARSAYPAILVEYARSGVPERIAGT